MKPFSRARLAAALLPALGVGLACIATAQTPPAAPAPATGAKPAATTTPNPEDPKPRLPLVPRTPARSEWTIRMTTEFNGSSWESGDEWEKIAESITGVDETRTIRSQQVSKDAVAKVYHIRTRWSDGKSEEEWVLGNQHVAERPAGGFYIVGSEASTSRDLQKTDFPELEWLDMSHYRGLKTYKGKKVFLFSVPFDERRMSAQEQQLFMIAKQRDKTITPSKFFKPKASQIVAYLDAVTQLPVLYNDGSTIRRYTFNPPSEPRLRPSPAVVRFMNTRAEDLRIKMATPPGP